MGITQKGGFQTTGALSVKELELKNTTIQKKTIRISLSQTMTGSQNTGKTIKRK